MIQGILDFYSLTRLEDFEYYASMNDYETGNSRLLDGWSLLLASVRQLCLIVTLSVVRLVGHLSAPHEARRAVPGSGSDTVQLISGYHRRS